MKIRTNNKEGKREMADLRKIKKEKGSVLIPGANRLRRGVNFAVEVPQGVQASLVLYK